MPPAAARVCEYAAPAVQAGNELVVMLGGELMTCPLTILILIEFPLISPTTTLESVRAQVPLLALAVIVITANVPAVDTVCPGVIIAPPTFVKVPAALLMVPAIK